MEYHLFIFLKHSLARNNIGLDKLRPHAFALAKHCTDVANERKATVPGWPGSERCKLGQVAPWYNPCTSLQAAYWEDVPAPILFPTTKAFFTLKIFKVDFAGLRSLYFTHLHPTNHPVRTSDATGSQVTYKITYTQRSIYRGNLSV